MCICNNPDFCGRGFAFLYKIKIGRTVKLVPTFKIMCLSPVQIVNPSKYISLKYRDPYLLHVPCGHCAECQQTLSNQWFLRAWHECLDLQSFGENAFLYFDTLTYAPEYLPHLDEIIPEFPHKSCFRPLDIRNFLESLRIHLKRKYKSSSFRYFLSSEYGSERFTNRPHYHILFFVKKNDSNLTAERFSLLVSRFWRFGRTDGIPWKPSGYVLSHNVILSNSLPASYLRACRYVTKYVQKSCIYSKSLDDLLNRCMYKIAEKMPENWLDSVHSRRVRSSLKRRVCQFHRQSKHFGESALNNIDLFQLFETGVLFMPSPKGLKIPVPLSTYYKRKLFYDLVEVDGCKTWQLNSLGVQYRDYRKIKLIDDLASVFSCASKTYHLNIDEKECLSLADYVYNTQGRIKADCPSDNLFEKLPSVTLYNYVTLSDKERLSHVGIVNRFLGNNSIGYRVDELPPSYRIKDFIAKYVFLDEDKEKQLSKIYYHLGLLNDGKQQAYELTQRLEDLYKSVRCLCV